MDGRFQPRTITSRPPARRPAVERNGNVLELRFRPQPEPVRMATSAWYHAAAIAEEAGRSS